METEKRPEQKILFAFKMGQKWCELTGYMGKQYQVTTAFGGNALERFLSCGDNRWSALLIGEELFMELCDEPQWQERFDTVAKNMPILLLVEGDLPKPFSMMEFVTDIIRRKEHLGFAARRVRHTAELFRLQQSVHRRKEEQEA